MVCDISDREAELAGQVLVGEPRLALALQVVELEQPKVDRFAARSHSARSLSTARLNRLRIHSFSKNSSIVPGAGGSLRASSPSAVWKSSDIRTASPPRLMRRAALSWLATKPSTQVRRKVRRRDFAGS